MLSGWWVIGLLRLFSGSHTHRRLSHSLSWSLEAVVRDEEQADFLLQGTYGHNVITDFSRHCQEPTVLLSNWFRLAAV